eukprot:gene24418-10017_t
MGQGMGGENDDETNKRKYLFSHLSTPFLADSSMSKSGSENARLAYAASILKSAREDELRAAYRAKSTPTTAEEMKFGGEKDHADAKAKAAARRAAAAAGSDVLQQNMMGALPKGPKPVGREQVNQMKNWFQAIFPDIPALSKATKVASYSGSLTLSLAFGAFIYAASTGYRMNADEPAPAASGTKSS